MKKGKREFLTSEKHRQYDRGRTEEIKEGGMLTLHRVELDHCQDCSASDQCGQVGQPKDQLASIFAS